MGGRLSVIRNEHDEWFKHLESKTLPDCTFCSGRLSFPFVYWMANGIDLTLHPVCVLDWSLRMYRDVLEIKRELGLILKYQLGDGC